MKFSVTLLVCLTVFLLLLDLCHCDDIDRTFFKKKKEKKKEKKPSYKPSYNNRTFHKKNKEKKKPSYRPSYHPPAAPSYHQGNQTMIWVKFKKPSPFFRPNTWSSHSFPDQGHETLWNRGGGAKPQVDREERGISPKSQNYLLLQLAQTSALWTFWVQTELSFLEILCDICFVNWRRSVFHDK